MGGNFGDVTVVVDSAERIEITADRADRRGFAVDVGGICSLISTVHIKCRGGPDGRRRGETCDPETGSSAIIVPADTPAIAEERIDMTVQPPRDRPQVTPVCLRIAE